MQTAGFSSDAYKPGLGQMFDYAAFLGDPQLRWRGVHVAGTNGKGSVCSMLAAALAAGGLKTGLYTSPHLVDFRERIKVLQPGAEMISEAEVCEFLEGYDREGLSFFEVTTGMAFKWFAYRGVDVAVIETGLGGRLDSTNIIMPLISIITSIGLDHCALLPCLKVPPRLWAVRFILPRIFPFRMAFLLSTLPALARILTSAPFWPPWPYYRIVMARLL